MVEISRITDAPVVSTGKPYSQACRVGDLVFVSGQIALDSDTCEPESGGFEAQVRRVFENLGVVLRHAGADLDTVVKTTCFLVDLANVDVFNSVYREYFDADNLPARSTFQVAGLSPGIEVEIEAVAAIASPR